jgi:hypothetical protein
MLESNGLRTAPCGLPVADLSDWFSPGRHWNRLFVLLSGVHSSTSRLAATQLQLVSSCSGDLKGTFTPLIECARRCTIPAFVGMTGLSLRKSKQLLATDVERNRIRPTGQIPRWIAGVLCRSAGGSRFEGQTVRICSDHR